MKPLLPSALLAITLLAGCSGETDAAATTDDQAPPTSDSTQTMKRVTGIGGVFFKSKDPEAQRDWYRDHLGLVTNEYGSVFEFRATDNPDEKGYLQWSPFGENTTYFEPSEREFMINYRVENLERLIELLKEEGVEIVDTMETYEYGKFVHIMDPEGNKIELWEPVDTEFTRLYEGKTTH